MAPHKYTCPRCAWPVKPPVQGQTEAIVCLNCRAQIEPMTGAILNGDPAPQAQPAGPPPAKKTYPRKPLSAAAPGSAAMPQGPIQAGPQPVQYPAQQPPMQYPPQYPAQTGALPPPRFMPHTQAQPGHPGAFYGPPPATKRGMPRWGWGLIAVGGVVLIALVLTGVLVIGSSETSTDNWVKYTAPDKSFTAMFPAEPTFRTQRMPNGLVLNETIYRAPMGHWEISWFDWPGGPVPYDAIVAEFSKASSTSITRSESRAWKGFNGHYAEFDNGAYNVQVMATPGRLWTVAAFRQSDTFQFFLDNLNPSDQAMGIHPLEVEFSQTSTGYEGGGETRWQFVITGGHKPYSVKFSKPFPDTRHDKQNYDSTSSEVHTGVSARGTAGSHRVEISVTDADGRTATGTGQIIVMKLPDTLGELYVEMSYGHLGREVDAVNTIQLPLGCRIFGGCRFTAEDNHVQIAPPAFTYEDLPSWLTLTHGRTARFDGVPEELGTYKFKALTGVRITGVDKWYPLEREVTIEVIPVPESEVPKEPGVFSKAQVTGKVGENLSGFVEFQSPVPLHWRGHRSWEISAKWVLTDEEMQALLPKGMTLKHVLPFPGDTVLRMEFSGIPEVAFNQEIEFKLVATVKYLPKPVEMGTKVKFTIKSVAAPSSLPEAAETVIQARAGRRLDTMVSFDAHASGDLPSTATYSIEWSIEGVVLPVGIRLEVFEHPETRSMRVMVRGSIATPGEYSLEIPFKVKLLREDKTYDLTQKVKLVIS